MSIYDVTVKKSNGEEYSLKQYEGKAMLIVNTATKCGFSDQFDSLETLHNKYKEDGLMVLGFPSNSFKQELSNAVEAEQSCRMSYGVTFPMHEMVEVKGKNTHPLFNYLTNEKKGFLSNHVKWNFTKFLVDKDGNVVGRYAPNNKPEAFEKDIQKVL